VDFPALNKKEENVQNKD